MFTIMCLLLGIVCVTHADTQQHRDALRAWRLEGNIHITDCSVCAADHVVDNTRRQMWLLPVFKDGRRRSGTSRGWISCQLS